MPSDRTTTISFLRMWNPVKELKAVFVTEDQFATMVPVESGGGAESQLTAMV